MMRIHTVSAVATGAAILLSLVAIVFPGHKVRAANLDREVTFHIAAQPLSSGLIQFSDQAGVQVVSRTSAVAMSRTGGIQGLMSVHDGLTRLLAGTGLSYLVVGDETVAVVNRAAISSVTSGPTTSPVATDPPVATTAPAASTVSTAASATQTTQLGTIQVTANKRVQPIQQVPMAVSVLTGIQLKRLNAVNFADYVTLLPGFNYISAGEGQTQLVLRGITSGSTQFNPAVGTYIDDTPFGSSTIYANGSTLTPDIDPADIERIEVLRGPQGTLYGANTLGGLIKFVTTPPDTNNYLGRVSVGGSSVADGGDGFGINAMVNVPLVSNTLGLRMNVYQRQDPGYYDNVATGASNANNAKVKGGRAQMLWTPTDKVSVNFLVLAQNLNGGDLANGGVDVNPATQQPIYGDLKQSHPPGTGWLTLKYRLYSATVNADFGWAKLVSATSYGTVAFNENADLTDEYGPVLNPTLGITNGGYSLLEPIDQTKFTQEIRLQSPSTNTWEWRVGLFYTHEHSINSENVLSFDATTGEPITLPTLADVQIGPALFTEYAAFGDLTYHFTPRFDVTVGARSSHDRTEMTQIGNGLLIGPSNFTTTGTDSPTTYLFNPKFKFNDDVMMYARVASGYRPGGPNVGVPPSLGAPITFGPDKLWSYSVGVKSTLLDKHMTLDADAFYVDWSQIQFSTTINGITFLSNGGKAKSQGVEASWQYLPLDNLRFSANATYTEAELTQNTPQGLFGFSGDQLPYVPKWNANVGVDYSFPITYSWQGFAGTTYSYVGSRKTDFNTIPGSRFDIPSYKVVGLYVGANHDQWTIEAYIHNLTNDRGITLMTAETINPLASPFQASIIQPRTVGVTLTYDF